ncbi:MAG: hypothetical protein LBU90_05775 [Bacteroidales bacterium]|jgi:hypothetical protein|nr:hypothetical protein [Bacteroidales bacterium]
MKKIYLLISVALLGGLGLQAQTLTLTNAYQRGNMVQGKVNQSLSLTKGVYKVSLTASSSDALDTVNVVLAYDDAKNNYWCQASSQGISKIPVAANTIFTKDFTLVVQNNTCNTSGNLTLTINALSKAFPDNAGVSKASKTVTFSNFSINVTKLVIPEGTLFTERSDGIWQLDVAPAALPAPHAVGDKFIVVVKGTPSADITQLSAVAVDQSTNVNFWKESSNVVGLSNVAGLSKNASSFIGAGTNFSVEGIVTVTEIPADWRAANANTIALRAEVKSEEYLFGIKNLSVSVVPYVEGCPDYKASNFNPRATKDDGSCKYEVIVGLQTLGSGEIYNGTTKLSNSITAEIGKSFTFTAKPAAGWEFVGWRMNNSLSIESATFDYTFVVGKNTNSVTAKFARIPVLGCTDKVSINYNADATMDDGSCLYAVRFHTTGSGNIVKDDKSIIHNNDAFTVAQGTCFTVYAMAESGWKFAGWRIATDSITNTQNPLTFCTKGYNSYDYTAEFTQSPGLNNATPTLISYNTNAPTNETVAAEQARVTNKISSEHRQKTIVTNHKSKTNNFGSTVANNPFFPIIVVVGAWCLVLLFTKP